MSRDGVSGGRARTDVCVVIAARDAAGTIGQAVASALAEPEVARVVVVDDGSRDLSTGEAARAAAGGSDRLEVMRLDANRGPAFARNRAIERSSEAFVAVLDADDFFLPGRFARVFAERDWDFAADNIAFFPEGTDAASAAPRVAAIEARPDALDLAAFVEGNLPRSGLQRGELGFLKPVMRRTFLQAHGLAYDESLRLGEDYDLYARALAARARFLVLKSCGYGALVRGASLSGRHTTDDLRRFAAVDAALLARPDLGEAERAAIRRHERHSQDRFRLRRYLDMRRAEGLGRTLLRLAADPPAWRPVLGGTLSDKLARRRAGAPAPVDAAPRYLFPREG